MSNRSVFRSLAFFLALPSAFVAGCDEEDIDDVPVLLATRLEAPGANCATGGTAIDAGRDLDRDSVLAPTEVESTAYACRPELASRQETIRGSVSIWNEADVEALAGVKTITGDLIVEADGIEEIRLADLITLGGSLRVEEMVDVDRVAFPALTTVGGVSIWSSSAVFDLAALTTITGDIRLESVQFSGPALTDIVGELYIEAATFSAPSLVYLGGIEVYQSSQNQIFPKLETIAGNASFMFSDYEELRFPELRTIGGSAFGVSSIPTLTTLDMPKLEQPSNSMSISIGFSPALNACAFQAKVAGWVANGWTGNASITGTLACE